jgi:accessory gene regulator B
MIDLISLRLARYIHDREPSSSVEVLHFALLSLFNTGLTLGLLILAGILVGQLLPLLLLAFPFAVLRMLTGGAHLSSSLLCSFITVLVFTAFSFVQLQTSFSFLLTILTFWSVWIYAPFLEDYQQQKTEQKKKTFKQFALIWITASFFIHWMGGPEAFLLGAFIQSITLTPGGIRFIRFIDFKKGR